MAVESERFVRRARAEYDGYLLIEDEYIKESFRIIYENARDMNEEIETLKAKLTAAETNITSHTH